MSDILHTPWNEDESEPETAIESDIKTQSSSEESRLAERLNTLRTLLRKRQEREKIMSETESLELPNAKNGRELIERGNARLEGYGGQERSQDFQQPTAESLTKLKNKLDSEQSTKSLPLGLSVPSSSSSLRTSEMIASESMSLLDESANHIFDLMKGLHANQPPAEVKAYDPDRVNSAVACANTIYKIMRLKLDAIKVKRKMT